MSVTKIAGLEAALDPQLLDEHSTGYIITQVACTLRLNFLPAKFCSTLGLSTEYPIDSAWRCFGLVEKIAVFTRKFGFRECARQIPSWPQMASASSDREKWIEGLQAYQKRIHKATQGHLTAFMLSHYDVLQMLIFSALHKIIELEAQHNARAFEMTGEEAREVSTHEALEKVHESLLECFYTVNKIIACNSIEDMALIPKGWLQAAALSIGSYQQSLESKKDNPLAQRKAQEIAHLKEMIDLIREAFESPVDRLPILISPFLSQRYDRGSIQSRDHIHLAPEVLEWVDDFRRVCKFYSGQYFKSLLKATTGQKKVIESSRQQFISLLNQAEEVNNTLKEKVLRLLKFQAQPAHKQLQKFQTLNDLRCIDKLQPTFEKVIELHANLRENLPLHPEKWKMDGLITYPFRHYSNLVQAVFSVFETKRAELLNDAFMTLTTTIPAHHQTLNSPLISSIDLLDFQFRSLYLNLGVNQDDILVVATSAFSTMRTLYATSKTVLDYEGKSLCIYGERQLFNAGLKLINQDKKFLPMIVFLGRLAQLLKHDSWPALISTPPKQALTATLAEERRFFYEYFLSIRNLFLAYDYRTFLSIKQQIPEEETAILKLFEECKTKIQEDAPPSLEKYEAPALQFCEQIGELVGAVQEHLVKILEIFPEDAELADEIDATHRFLQALLISPLQNLAPYLIGWDLVETEKKQAPKPPPVVITRRARPKTSPPRVSAPPATPKETPKPQPKPLEEPTNLEEYHTGIHTLLRRLTQDHLGFVSPDPHAPKKEKALLNIQHTLHHLQPLMLSIPLYGHLPGVIWEFHSRLGVLLEQTLQAAAYVLELPIPEELFHKHDPEQIFDHLKGLKLSAEERAVIHKGADLLLASRYPAMRKDELAKNLTALLKMPAFIPIIQGRFQGETQKVLLAHLTVCFKILNSLPHSGQGEVRNAQDSLAPLKKEFRGPVAAPAFPRLLSQLKRMRFLIHQPLQAVAPREISLWKRKSTLYTSHRELMLMIPLARDLLATPRDPALVLYMGTEALKIEACLLEHVLLMVLAKVPCPSANPSSHFLYEKPVNPLRYSHRLDLFVKQIRDYLKIDDALIDETLKRAVYLTPYLKQLYRYLPEEDTGALNTSLAQLRTLSYLWENQEDLSKPELQFLDGELGLQPFANYILNLLEREYLASLSRTLELTSKWFLTFQSIRHL